MSEALRLRKILCPTDFSPTADRALETAMEFARSAGPAEITLAHANFVPLEIEALGVYGPAKVLEDLAKAAREQLDQRLERLRSAGVSAHHVHADGRPDEVILELARREGTDLIVMGTHGRTGLSHVLLGSVAERVLRRAECPVMTVPPVESGGHEASG